MRMNRYLIINNVNNWTAVLKYIVHKPASIHMCWWISRVNPMK